MLLDAQAPLLLLLATATRPATFPPRTPSKMKSVSDVDNSQKSLDDKPTPCGCY